MHSMAFPAFKSLQPSSNTSVTFSLPPCPSNPAVTSAILFMSTPLSLTSPSHLTTKWSTLYITHLRVHVRTYIHTMHGDICRNPCLPLALRVVPFKYVIMWSVLNRHHHSEPRGMYKQLRQEFTSDCTRLSWAACKGCMHPGDHQSYTTSIVQQV